MASLTDDIAPLNTKPDTLNRCPVLAAVNYRFALQSLPLWGRWHGEAVTEEGSTVSPNLSSLGEMLLHLSRPLRGHPPQRGGLFIYP